MMSIFTSGICKIKITTLSRLCQSNIKFNESLSVSELYSEIKTDTDRRQFTSHIDIKTGLEKRRYPRKKANKLQTVLLDFIHLVI